MWSRFTGAEAASRSPNAEQEKQIVHRKRVAKILHYISTLQSSKGAQFSFIRRAEEHVRPFYASSFRTMDENDEDDEEYARVLFSTFDFQRLATLSSHSAEELPFSFYTTTTNNANNKSSPSHRKRSAWGSFKPSNHTNDDAAMNASCCWLRLTRLTQRSVVPPSPSLRNHFQVEEYLQTWSQQSSLSVTQLLTIKHLKQAPLSRHSRVSRFVRQYQTYLYQKELHRHLEPIYNSLFEWYSEGGTQNNDLDLIWGLGQALWKDKDSGTVVDGPLLEVKVEVQLASDGALLVRPKKHTGVTWNRNVLAALDSTSSKKWNALVDALDPCNDVNPSQSMSYVPWLKQLAVECSAGGTFVPASQGRHEATHALVITDAWCLYASPRPSAVWARDALAFGEGLEKATTTLPRALWALTHGPSAMQDAQEEAQKQEQKERLVSVLSNLLGLQSKETAPVIEPVQEEKRLYFPLPTSEAQNRIADLLLNKQYPAVVCEGPPGTGKTHTIANIVCAYLCQGKRVLVTSKGAPALSVLRNRLPACVQELCVDVSMSESVGMRQLQQTVERLANKVSYVRSEREQKRSQALQEEIELLKVEQQDIDDQLRRNAEQKRIMVQTPQGQELFETGLELIRTVPWLAKSMTTWDLKETSKLYKQIENLVVSVQSNEPILQISDHPRQPSGHVISLAGTKAGAPTSMVKNAAKGAFASVPWLGSGMLKQLEEAQSQLDAIKIYGLSPCTKDHWKEVANGLEKERAIQLFCSEVLVPLIAKEGWPKEFFIEENSDERRRIKADVLAVLEASVKLKTLEKDLGTDGLVRNAETFAHLDARRTTIASRIQSLSEELVACRVIFELSRGFTPEAQSALVKFSQVAGKARFGKSSSQPHKMTQRQRRKRQEYLDAFEKCVRYIPSWILTCSQVSDYLPAECLFDLVVIDESSQSDVSVLPTMLRAHQWLIVGDGKQVSPTESFVAEEQILQLKSALPDSPFESSMLPGHSFFDLCSQAFPKGRVILREHFRCAPEIISYSNNEFYNNSLVPLRLPTRDERLNPSLIDVYLPRGKKIGKVNPDECDEIVRRIAEYVDTCHLVRKRSIGVISLVGEEQSRLIRGRLLDRIGPHKYKIHDILVGEPPSFQGAERDVVFLSMVCSKGFVPTQSQLMHSQRVNVALSRARDRMVLVRSIQANHIPNDQDIKLSVLDFFERCSNRNMEEDEPMDVLPNDTRVNPSLSPFRSKAEQLLEQLLKEGGFSTRSMGVVWEDAICVEDANNKSARAAICVEATGESQEEWNALLEQQKSIERVGWKCLRVDGLSLLSSHTKVMADVEKFLLFSGVRPVVPPEMDEDVVMEHEEAPPPAEPAMAVAAEPNVELNVEEDDEVVVISGDEYDDKEDAKMPAAPLGPPTDSIEQVAPGLGNGETASDYGDIAGLNFLMPSNSSVSSSHSRQKKPTARRERVARARAVAASSNDLQDTDEDEGEEDDLEEKQRAVSKSTRQTFANDDLSFSSSEEAASTAAASRSSKRRRVNKYARDARWYPSRKPADQDEDVPFDEFLGEVLPEKSTNGDTAARAADSHPQAAMDVDHNMDGEEKEEEEEVEYDDKNDPLYEEDVL